MTKISQLSSIGDSLAVNDQFLIRDVDDATTPNKSVTVSGITRALDVGSATAPAIAFASDKNTGIYSPGADQVAISTNGAGRLFVDASGQVGVGTNSPIGNAANVYLTVNGSTLGGIALQSNGATVGYLQGEASLVRISSDGAKPITFDTNGTERLRITSAGLVGIGTTSPAGPLDIAAGGAGPARVIVSQVSDNPYIDIYRSTGSGSNFAGFRLSTPSISGELAFSNAAGTTIGSHSFTERARIDSSGRLLVGTSTALGSERFNADSRFIVQTASKTLGVNGGGNNTLTLSLPAVKYITGHLYVSSSPENGNKGTMSIYKVFIMTISGQAGIGTLTLEQTENSTYSAGIVVARSGRDIVVTNGESGYFNNCVMVFHGLVSN